MIGWLLGVISVRVETPPLCVHWHIKSLSKEPHRYAHLLLVLLNSSLHDSFVYLQMRFYKCEVCLEVWGSLLSYLPNVLVITSCRVGGCHETPAWFAFHRCHANPPTVFCWQPNQPILWTTQNGCPAFFLTQSKPSWLDFSLPLSQIKYYLELW